MKINHFFALALIALLVVGAMGIITMRSFAQTANPPAAQSQDCTANQADDATEAKGASADTDTIDLQCGDQNEADAGEAVNGPDADNIQDGDQNGADTGKVGEAGDGQDAVPAGTPAITADTAKATAEAYLNVGAATQVELDDENGQLVYSVEIGATDVKVDAMTGAVIGQENGED